MRVLVKPLAFDSMGVRSMATYVETRDARIVIDPGVALAPRRFGLPPHDLERRRLMELARVVEEHARIADVIIVTHYHYDHHDLGKRISLEIYDGKLVFVKNPEENINRSQAEVRAPRFLRAIRGRPRRLEYADGNSLKIGNTEILFSEAVPHGSDPRLGYVVQVAVREGDEVFLYTSDVEGPALREQLKFALEVNPTMAYVDGPMTYMLGYRYSEESLRTAIENLVTLIEETDLRTLVLDHHFARDLECWDHVDEVVGAARGWGIRLVSAAEEAGESVRMLEAMRRELYGRASASRLEA